jgi:hypothetical protein
MVSLYQNALGTASTRRGDEEQSRQKITGHREESSGLLPRHPRGQAMPVIKVWPKESTEPKRETPNKSCYSGFVAFGIFPNDYKHT